MIGKPVGVGGLSFPEKIFRKFPFRPHPAKNPGKSDEVKEFEQKEAGTKLFHFRKALFLRLAAGFYTKSLEPLCYNNIDFLFGVVKRGRTREQFP
jgi:hypothetical protein